MPPASGLQSTFNKKVINLFLSDLRSNIAKFVKWVNRGENGAKWGRNGDLGGANSEFAAEGVY